MNIDRAMLVAVVTLLTVVWAVMYVQGLAMGAVPWWQIPLAVAIYFGLEFIIAAGCRRLMLSEKTRYFLNTIPVAAMVLVMSTHSLKHSPPGGLFSWFLIIEAIAMAVAAVGWQLQRREPESLI